MTWAPGAMACDEVTPMLLIINPRGPLSYRSSINSCWVECASVIFLSGQPVGTPRWRNDLLFTQRKTCHSVWVRKSFGIMKLGWQNAEEPGESESRWGKLPRKRGHWVGSQEGGQGKADLSDTQTAVGGRRHHSCFADAESENSKAEGDFPGKRWI